MKVEHLQGDTYKVEIDILGITYSEFISIKGARAFLETCQPDNKAAEIIRKMLAAIMDTHKQDEVQDVKAEETGSAGSESGEEQPKQSESKAAYPRRKVKYPHR